MSLFDKLFGSQNQSSAANGKPSNPASNPVPGGWTGTYTSSLTPNNFCNGFGTGCSCISCAMVIGAQAALTPEELRELEELEKARDFEVKVKKLEIFKKLPSALRQEIVNAVMWEKAVNQMNSMPATMSEREQYLHNKKYGIFGAFGRSGVMTAAYYTNQQIRNMLPEGITPDELITAHNEASMEEMIDEQN